MLLSARMQKKLWVVKPTDKMSATLADSLDIPHLVAQVLVNRGIIEHETAQTFLDPKLTGLIPPEKMPGIGPAVTRIIDAIKNEEKVTIYGDYDVDGITGVSILLQIITLLGGKPDIYIPHRIEEG